MQTVTPMFTPIRHLTPPTAMQTLLRREMPRRIGIHLVRATQAFPLHLNWRFPNFNFLNNPRLRQRTIVHRHLHVLHHRLYRQIHQLLQRQHLHLAPRRTTRYRKAVHLVLLHRLTRSTHRLHSVQNRRKRLHFEHFNFFDCFELFCFLIAF